MRYIYGITDIQYNFKDEEEEKKKRKAKTQRSCHFKYSTPALLARHPKFDRNEWPYTFRANAFSLLELCISAVDKLTLPSIFEWTDKDIRLWICRYGYPQYMHTFRVNMIWGRKLLFLDANALCTMNIKDFDHIKHITYGIRMLFHFELVKFSRSISLPEQEPFELYKMWHTQTGVNYDEFRCSDLMLRMQIIRERSKNLSHWDLLELWLRRERERKYTELIGYTRRFKLFKCEQVPVADPNESLSGFLASCNTCMPPCECHWTERDVMFPSRLLCLPRSCRSTDGRWQLHPKGCDCVPPCECGWPPKDYLTGTVLSCLKSHFSEKFAHTFENQPRMQVPESMLTRWTRFSV